MSKSKIKILLESLKEFELMYNLSPKLTKKQIKQLVEKFFKTVT